VVVDKFFKDMSWDDYRASRTGGIIFIQNEDWELELICTQMYNMMAEKPMKPHEYMPLATDEEVISILQKPKRYSGIPGRCRKTISTNL